MTMAESFPKRVENIVRKGEIAHYEQFLLFSQCFQKTLNILRFALQGLKALDPFVSG